MKIITLENGQKMKEIQLGGTTILTPHNDEPATPSIVSEPVDEEKVWLAEAIIQQSIEIEELRARIALLEGGS